jgi:hypothetical protein
MASLVSLTPEGPLISHFSDVPKFVPKTPGMVSRISKQAGRQERLLSTGCNDPKMRDLQLAHRAIGRMTLARQAAKTDFAEHLLTEQVLICRFSPAESIRIMQLRWACSSAGRASALQAGGRRFEPGHVHQPSACNFNHLLIRPSCDFLNLGPFGSN